MVDYDLFPFTSHWFDRGQGLRMHYVDEGQGHPVVMVHGNPSWSFYFRSLISGLQREVRALAIDHIGCGLSDKPLPPYYDYSLRERVDDFSKWIQTTVPTEPITLVLHDWGGMIGMAWAVQNPHRIGRLVILNTGAFPLPSTKRLPWPLWLARNKYIGACLVRGLNAFSIGACYTCVTRRPMPRHIRQMYCLPYDSWNNRIAVHRFVQTIPLKERDPGWDIVVNTAESLQQFRDTPTLIAWGMRDFVFDQHFLYSWQKHLPKAEVHRFADSGHYILEDAGHEVLQLVRTFLRLTPDIS